MATYYAKPFEAIDKTIYDVNPAAYLGQYRLFGRFPLTITDPWGTDYVHYNAVEKAANIHFGDNPRWADSDSLPHPGFVKFKFMSWSTSVTWKQYESIKAEPTGMMAQQIAKEIKGQEDYFAKSLDDYLINYLSTVNATTTRDYDAEWLGLMALRNTTNETVRDPQDVCDSAGTVTNLATVNFMGAGQVVDAVEKSFGVQQDQFWQQYDSINAEAMYKNQGNTFDAFLHPAALKKIERAHLSNASGEVDYSQNVGQIINEMGISLHPTFSVDSAYDGAVDTVAEIVMNMNTKDNFRVAELIPYTVTPWEEFKGANNQTKIFRKMGYMKLGCMITPYYLNSAWRKATLSFQVTPYGA